MKDQITIDALQPQRANLVKNVLSELDNKHFLLMVEIFRIAKVMGMVSWMLFIHTLSLSGFCFRYLIASSYFSSSTH